MPSQESYHGTLLGVIDEVVARAGGGSAFRKESAVERLFRDSRAARLMSPTTDHLHDFVGRALLGLPLLGEV
jgi:alkylation response protein AidB-like acyl-CoA dehydrogenase